MATRGQSGNGVQLAHLNARLTAALDRLDAIRHAALRIWSGAGCGLRSTRCGARSRRSLDVSE